MPDDIRSKAEAGRDAFFKWVGAQSTVAPSLVPAYTRLDGCLAMWLESGGGAKYATDGYGLWLYTLGLIIDAWVEDPSLLKVQGDRVLTPRVHEITSLPMPVLVEPDPFRRIYTSVH